MHTCLFSLPFSQFTPYSAFALIFTLTALTYILKIANQHAATLVSDPLVNCHYNQINDRKINSPFHRGQCGRAGRP